MSDTTFTIQNARPPVDWKVQRLAVIADIRISNVDKKSIPGELPVRLCNYMDVYGNEYIRRTLPFMEATANSVELARFTVKRGDVLATKDSETPDDIGVPAVVTDEIPNLVCGYHLAQIKPYPDLVESVFLSKQISHDRIARYFSRLANGSTRYGLATSSFENLEVWLPQLPEQLKIARILTTLDNLIEKTEALIAKYQAIKQGMMHDLFTRGINEHGHLRPSYDKAPELYKESELGWIPREWKCSPLWAVSQHVIDCPHSTPEYLTAGVLVARTSEIREGNFDLQNASYVSEAEYESRISRLEPQPNDIIFTREAPVGEAFIVPTNMRICLGQRVMLIRLDFRQCDPHFFLFQLYSSNVRRRLDHQTGGTTNPHLNVKDVRSFEFVVPTFAEQTMIGTRLSALDERMNAENRFLMKLSAAKTGLMQDLLTGKVRVKVDKSEEVKDDE